jgi:gamma-glutamyl phosphate reductase
MEKLAWKDVEELRRMKESIDVVRPDGDDEFISLIRN